MWDMIKYEIPEMLDNWRVIPRLLIFMYAVVFYQTMNWFMLLENPNNAIKTPTTDIHILVRNMYVPV